MYTHIHKAKQDLKTLADRIRELKKRKHDFDSKNYPYSIYRTGKSEHWRSLYKWMKPIKIMYQDKWLVLDFDFEITEDILNEQNKKNNEYSKCVGELELAKIEFRHLAIVYAHFRGKTREQVEKNYAKCTTYSTYNPITKRHIVGEDPLDWNYIWELKKQYLEEIQGE